MRYSQLFGKTIKSEPSDATAVNHKLLHKGGFIRQVSAGRYVFLPLGYRVWEKIIAVIEQEMQNVGSQRVTTPLLHPIEMWQTTNRDKAFGGEMHVIEDHHGATFALGATAEVLMTEIVKDFKPSYKDLPIYIHQFIGKFRDEKRPKGGLLRVREFVMKDAYSFDVSEEAAFDSYTTFFNAYLRIAEKLDLKVTPVLSDSGAIGGDLNHEFLVETDMGEAYAFLCDSCDYAAQIEKAESLFETYEHDSTEKEVQEFINEEAVTCEKLAELMGIQLHETTKTILFKADGRFVAAMVRGDYNINETKLKKHLGASTLELASEKEIFELTGAKVGFMGPVDLPDTVQLVGDISSKDRKNFEAGGNRTGVHLYNLNFGRDVPTPEFADIREVKAGDTCINCKHGKLKMLKGIEWGHCFKLDQVYAKPHNATFVDKDGSEKYFWMGSYGIGIGRCMSTLVETHNDEKGIMWPKSVAPFTVHLVGLNLEDAQVARMANSHYEKLVEAGVEVLFDERVDVSAGAKFADADLIGCPYRVVVSKKTGDTVEVKKRNEQEATQMTFDSLLKLITN